MYDVFLLISVYC